MHHNPSKFKNAEQKFKYLTEPIKDEKTTSPSANKQINNVNT